MAGPGIKIGDWLTHISNTGPNKSLSIRIEHAIRDNEFKEYYLECMKAAEAGKKEFRKEGRFVPCQDMIDNFDDENIKVEFHVYSIVFSWGS